MNTEVKDKWIAALRSGKYEQTTNALRNNNEYCCLGVLCDLYNPILWKEIDSDIGYNITYLEEDILLPGEVLKYADLVYEGKSVVILSFTDRLNCPVTLSGANDTGCTFDQIADLIEYFL